MPKITLTIAEHENLSFYQLGWFMIENPIVIADKKDHIILYCSEWKGCYFHDMPRFKEVIPGKLNREAELAYFKIPKTTKLYNTINKYFKHLYLID